MIKAGHRPVVIQKEIVVVVVTDERKRDPKLPFSNHLILASVIVPIRVMCWIVVVMAAAVDIQVRRF